ncbi:MAG: Fic family protein [Candidatus Omnitrophica bacterium]|nr:Fic family protein [Candidatus Omnitrophota bacterium]
MEQNFIEKYPWVSFGINLKGLPYKTWIQLGECLSKCEHIAQIPLKPNTAKEMHKAYLAKGVCATTAIEGNSLSEEEVRKIIDKKLTLSPSRKYLEQEVNNILELCNEIKNKVCTGQKLVISIDEIKRFNKNILKNVPCPDHAIPGEFRTVQVGVGVYRAVDHNDVHDLMVELCDWLNSDYFKMPNVDPVISDIIKAIAAHLYIEWIHPFGDGNGRLGRLLEFAILICSGIPSPAAHLISNHYNATRNEYYIQLDAASKKRDICDFISYAVQGFRDGLMEQLRYIFTQVLETSWESFVYEIFKEHKLSEKPTKRIRTLILELSHQSEPVPRDKLIMLSPKTIELYKSGSNMMLSRDINILTELDLIEKTEKGYKAKAIEKMLGFLPARARSSNKK